MRWAPRIASMAASEPGRRELLWCPARRRCLRGRASPSPGRYCHQARSLRTPVRQSEAAPGQADLQILVSLVPDPLSELDDGCIADADNLAQFSNGQINYLLRMGSIYDATFCSEGLKLGRSPRSLIKQLLCSKASFTSITAFCVFALPPVGQGF